MKLEENKDYKVENGHSTIPNSVTKIGNMAFAHNNLTSVTIPNRFKDNLEIIFGVNYTNIEFTFI